MEEPSLTTGRLLIAGGLLAMIVAGIGGFLLGRGSPTPGPGPVVAPTAAAPVPVSEEPEGRLPAVLGRGEIIALARLAADATAAARPLPTAVEAAVGRRFTLRLPFGCDGPSDESGGALLRWDYDAAASALRLHVAPVSWQAGDWWPQAGAPEVEAIEGYWVDRPWTTSDSCPPVRAREAAGLGSAILPSQILAIAQFLPAGTPRQALRERDPFEAVVRVPSGELDTRQGFGVRLTGRIDRVPGGGSVRCIQPAGSGQRPICVVAAAIAEVAIENPATGQVLSTWTVSRATGR